MMQKKILPNKNLNYPCIIKVNLKSSVVIKISYLTILFFLVILSTQLLATNPINACNVSVSELDLTKYTASQSTAIALGEESGLARNVFNEDEFFIIEQFGNLALWNVANIMLL